MSLSKIALSDLVGGQFDALKHGDTSKFARLQEEIGRRQQNIPESRQAIMQKALEEAGEIIAKAYDQARDIAVRAAQSIEMDESAKIMDEIVQLKIALADREAKLVALTLAK